MKQESREFWNEKFAQDEYLYGTEPNAFIADRVPAFLDAGKSVVCLGEGEGRNAVWLASQGYRVTAVEQSDAGIAKIQRLAKERHVQVETVRSSIEDFAPETTFDAVVLTYIHARPGEREKNHARAKDILSAGGLVFLEAYTPEQRILGRTSGGPPVVELLFTPEMLAEDFRALDIEYLEAVETVLAEGPGHRGLANVVRLIARKK